MSGRLVANGVGCRWYLFYGFNLNLVFIWLVPHGSKQKHGGILGATRLSKLNTEALERFSSQPNEAGLEKPYLGDLNSWLERFHSPKDRHANNPFQEVFPGLLPSHLGQ